MKHDWEEVLLDIAGKPAGTRCVMLHRWRVCRNCRKKQRYDTEYSWMRVVGHRWVPRAGRCTPNATGHLRPDSGRDVK